MRRLLAALLSTTALGVAACGSGGEESANQTQPPSGGEGQPPAQRTQPPAEQQGGQSAPTEGGQRPTTEELVRGTEAAGASVAEAARRLAENPSADVSEQLATARQRAVRLAEQARQPLQDARGQAEDLAQQGRESLSAEEEAALRRSLAQVNEGTAEAAERLRRVVDPQVAERVARDELLELAEELQGTVGELDVNVPRNLENRVRRLRDRLQQLRP